MKDFLVELALPKTDAAVFRQWIVAAVLIPIAVAATWRQPRDIRHFVWGLAFVTVGWFAARTVH